MKCFIKKLVTFKRLLALLFLGVLSVPAFAGIETTDVRVDSYTYKAVQINSTGWTSIIDLNEISVSTGGTQSKIRYTLVGWQGRHLDTTSDMAIVTDTMTNVANVIPLKGVTETYVEKQMFKQMSARMKSTVTGTVTFYMQIGYRDQGK